MSDLARFTDWVLAHPDAAKTVVGGAEELLGRLRVPAASGTGPARTFTGIPSADRALAEAAGIAAIAERRGVTFEQIFEVATLIARVALAVL